MDKTESLRGTEITRNCSSEKGGEIQKKFKWGIGPEALYQTTRTEYETVPDGIAVNDLIRLFNEYFLRKTFYHNLGNSFRQGKLLKPKHRKASEGY